MINKVFPYPLLSFSLFVMWVMLAGTYTPASFVCAGLLATVVPFAVVPLSPEKPIIRLRRVGSVLKLSGVVFKDIVRSNIAVLSIIFGHKYKERVSGFVYVPLTMRNIYGLAVLGFIVTCTPGTLWVQYDPRSGRLLLHVLDLVDESEWVVLIKNRYERLLMEIFE